MNSKKYDQVGKLLTQIDIATELIGKYDAIPHVYGGESLYQAEAYIVSAIGQHPGVTISTLAEMKNRTKSACSQTLKKLIAKGLVYKERNLIEYREFNLFLTERGQELYEAHTEFNDNVTMRYCAHIYEGGFTEEDVRMAMHLLRVLNEEFELDVKNATQ